MNAVHIQFPAKLHYVAEGRKSCRLLAGTFALAAETQRTLFPGSSVQRTVDRIQDPVSLGGGRSGHAKLVVLAAQAVYWWILCLLGEISIGDHHLFGHLENFPALQTTKPFEFHELLGLAVL